MSTRIPKGYKLPQWARDGIPTSPTGLAADLIAALETPCVSTRVWACRQLAVLGPDRASAVALERFCLFPNKAVRTAAREAYAIVSVSAVVIDDSKREAPSKWSRFWDCLMTAFSGPAF